MNGAAYMLGMWLGALPPVFLINRLVYLILRAVLGRLPAPFVPHLLSFPICLTLAAYGLANGGPPAFAGAAVMLLVPQLVLFGIDWGRWAQGKGAWPLGR